MLGKLMNLLDTARGGALVVGSRPTLQLVSLRLKVQALALPINCVDGPMPFMSRVQVGLGQ